MLTLEESLKVIIVCIFAVTTLYILYKIYKRSIESFVPEEQNNNPLRESIELLQRILCTPLEEIQKAMDNQPKTDPLLYTCIRDITPQSLYELPANIDAILQYTIYYVHKQITETLQKNKDALTCKNTNTSESFITEQPHLSIRIPLDKPFEGYEPLVTTATSPVCSKAEAEEIRKESRKESCILQEELTPSQRADIIKDRYRKIKQLLENKEIQQILAEIQHNYEELQQLKKQMEDGTIRPQCGML